MGSIVKTIGKVIKKVGKALKKIAPVLLVAAAAYVGYGYMTGFQAGGWPQITEWGKSLMGGVGQGMPISEAANAAGGMVETGASTLGMESGMQEAAISADPSIMQDAASGEIDSLMSGLDSTATGSGVETGASTFGESAGGMIGGHPSEGGGLLTQIQDATNTRFTELMDQNLYPPLSNQVSSWTQAPAKGGVGDFFLGTAQANPMQTGVPWSGMGAEPYMFDLPGHPGMAGTTGYNPAIVAEGAAGANFFGGGNVAGGATFNVPTSTVAQTTTPSTVPYGGRNPYGYMSDQYAMGIPHTQEVGAMGKIAAMGKKAWGIYKGMWADNPWMAMWTTQKVIQTIAALLDDTEEKEAWRSRHVAGFEPGGPDEVRKRYGGNLPGGNINRAGVGEGMRTASVKTGPKPAGGVRTSAIDRKPQGLLGSKQPRQVERVVG